MKTYKKQHIWLVRMSKLTPTRKKYLLYISRFIEREHMSPSLQEIAEHFNVWHTGVHKQIILLKKSGYIKIKKGTKRGISLTEKGTEVCNDK